MGMTPTEDIILNSKSEMVGMRLSKSKVIQEGEMVELVAEDVEKLDSSERKFIKKLEEGGAIYQDQELWTKLISNLKRKLEDNKEKEDEKENVMLVNPTKKQRLITNFIKDEVKEDTENDRKEDDFVNGDKEQTELKL